ncbi:hypothetical protein BBJ28_00000036 [Nothophytophthora sp. Chile5]|nr:hypothetical protein BBJ28_00000036 [Nothophytophthora sp. Chile5]
MGGLGIDRELLYRKLFAFDHQLDGSLAASPDGHGSSADQLCAVIQTAVAQNRQEPLRQMLLQRLGYWLRTDVVPPFWRFFRDCPTLIQRSGRTRRGRHELTLFCAQQLTLALQFAEEAFAQCVQIASLFDDHPLSGRQPTAGRSMLHELRISFRCLVFEDAHAVERFEELLLVFFSMSFQKFRGKEKFQAFDSRPIRGALLQLEWLSVAEPALMRVLHSQVRQMVGATCGEVYDERFLAEMESWACSELLPWLDELLHSDGDASTRKWREILSRHVLQEFGSLRIKQLFEIIKEFPDSLTDEQNGDLFEELRRDNMRLIQHDDDSDDDEVAQSPAVNIYGSRELFVNEYRMMLADKLLQNLEYDTDRDVQTLELLKLRFGEESLQQCEIMVRDIEDSKRLNLNVRSTLERPASATAAAALAAMARANEEMKDEERHTESAKPLPVDATVVSQHFWPPLQGDDFALHPKVSKDIDAFKEAYHVLRNPRSLDWNPSLGSVQVRRAGIISEARVPSCLLIDVSVAAVVLWFQLSIELEGVERDFTVSPLQASIILHFEEKGAYVEELAAKLEVSDDLLLKHVSLWVNHGLVSFSSGRTELVASSSFQDTRHDDEPLTEELETAVSSDAQAEEDLKVLEAYIVGMLSNFGSLTIQRIHNMLFTFARSGTQPYTKTISGLSVVLSKLVDKGKLELVAGQYELAK